MTEYEAECKQIELAWMELAKVSEVPDWRKCEIAAEVMNRSPAVDGIENWKCEVCGSEWQESATSDYGRTTDVSNWPVLCEECLKARHG